MKIIGDYHILIHVAMYVTICYPSYLPHFNDWILWNLVEIFIVWNRASVVTFVVIGGSRLTQDSDLLRHFRLLIQWSVFDGHLLLMIRHCVAYNLIRQFWSDIFLIKWGILINILFLLWMPGRLLSISPPVHLPYLCILYM